MATNSKTTLHMKGPSLFLGPSGSEASIASGYIDGETPVTLTLERGNETEVDAQQAQFPIDIINEFSGGVIEIGLIQIEPALLGYALGITEDGIENNITGDDTYTTLAVKIVGTRRDGETWVLKSNYVKPVGDVALALTKKELTKIPLRFRLLEATSGNHLDMYIGSTNVTATLSTGALTRTADKGYHKVAAESGTTDDLDSITGSSLTDDELLRLQPDAGDTITMKHLNDTLELTGEADWAMTENDYIDLQYDSDGTKWMERGRHDHTVNS